ncbi:cell division cycle protein 48 homolog [Phtheirospermum japonicum]|uniref:Cell division cycle protein 48 homolog n=1 Tax=Phtheirospermum japonicum TaxID=374723 RepID=A0A830CMK6_9LAMI|nr:cell division cycle protein 48 homolog [Phtheirospermum japonicum]
MVLLCFVLDLRSLSLPILRDLKQLANCYAVSRSKINNRSDGTQSSSKPLLDRIGLCCVSRNRISCSDEMKMEDKIAAKQKLELTNGAHLAVDAVDFAAKLLQDIEREKRRSENPKAMEEDEDEVPEIEAAHFEESMKYANILVH